MNTTALASCKMVSLFWEWEFYKLMVTKLQPKAILTLWCLIVNGLSKEEMSIFNWFYLFIIKRMIKYCSKCVNGQSHFCMNSLDSIKASILILKKWFKAMGSFRKDPSVSRHGDYSFTITWNLFIKLPSLETNTYFNLTYFLSILPAIAASVSGWVAPSIRYILEVRNTKTSKRSRRGKGKNHLEELWMMIIREKISTLIYLAVP